MLPAPVLLSYFPKKTHARIRTARQYFGDCDAIWNATANELAQVWDGPTTHAFVAWRATVDPTAIETALTTAAIQTITIEDPAYPPQLRDLHDPPLCLFVRGNLARYTTSIAVVGARQMSSYGTLILERLIPPLASAGVTIVSGLAYGIDSAAHRATLAAGGLTHAVLGSGVDDRSIAPANHRFLAKDIIAAGGAILSEYPPGTEATKYSFPERNRIMAALTRATLVIEAGEKSGSLITASAALDIGRDVCTVPHPIHTLTGAGPNALLKQGAHVITSADDLLSLLDVSSVPAPIAATTPMTALEAHIHTFIQTEAKHIDAIIANTTEDKSVVMSTITIMEMRGLVRNMGNMMYIAV